MKYWTSANNPGPEFYYTDIWRQTVEDHLEVIRQAPNNTIVNIVPSDAYRYRNDCVGYLTSIGVAAEHHYVVLRLNGFTDGFEFDEFRTTLVIPNLEFIEELRLIAQTTYGQ